jgi:hypothetical protein
MFPDAWIEANSKLHLFIVLVGWEHMLVIIYIYIYDDQQARLRSKIARNSRDLILGEQHLVDRGSNNLIQGNFDPNFYAA